MNHINDRHMVASTFTQTGAGRRQHPSWRCHLALAALCFAAVVAPLAEAACVSNAGPKSNPLTYTDPGDGTIIYSGSGLQWSKCAVGLSGSNCGTGVASSLSWSAALVTARSSSLAGYTDWRLPNRQELASIIEETCSSPAFDPVFTNMPSGQIWSSTSLSASDAVSQSASSGLEFADPKSATNRVLLVRAGNGPVAYDAMGPATISASGPASGNITQGVPFDVVATSSVPLFEAVTVFFSVQAGSPTGILGGATSCTIAANQTSCTVTGMTFSGVSGPPLTLAMASSGGANTLSFGSLPVLNVLPAPQSITLTPPASATQFAPFDVVLTLSTAVSSATTFALSKQSGPTGTLGGSLSSLLCTVPASGTSCTFTGVRFDGFGSALVLTAAPSSGPAVPVTNASFNVASVPFTVSLALPLSAVVNAPFSAVINLAPPAPAQVTIDLIKTGGPAGSLQGPQQCVIATGGTGCTVTGLSFAALGNLQLGTSTTSAVPLDITQGSGQLDIVLPTYTITAIAPALVEVGAPFSVTLVASEAVAFPVPLTLSVVVGSGGALSGPAGCTIATGQTSCTINGLSYSAPGAVQLVASTPAEGAIFAYERTSILFAALTPVMVPTLSAPLMLLMGLLALLIGLVTIRRDQCLK